MIQIKIDDTDSDVVVINITDTGLSKSIVTFRRKCSSNLEAELLCNHLKERVLTRMEKVRQVEYDKGWSDKSKRIQKCKYFFRSLDLKASS